MKTARISLVVLCGALVAFSPRPLLAQIPDADTGELAAAETGPASPDRDAEVARLSRGLHEIVKLVKAGVDETVVLAFVESSPVAYRASPEEIVRLRELGVSNAVIAAALRRGEELRRRPAQVPQPAPAAPAAKNGASNPASSVVYPVRLPYPVSTPVTVYYGYSSYPYYNYPAAPWYGYGYGYGAGYYPRYYSSYPRSSYYYGGCYPRASFSVGFGGYYGGYRGGFHGGYRHCR